MTLKIILNLLLLLSIKNVQSETNGTTEKLTESMSIKPSDSSSIKPSESSSIKPTDKTVEITKNQSPKLSCDGEICTAEFYTSAVKDAFKVNGQFPKGFEKGKSLTFLSSNFSQIPPEIGKIFPDLEILNVTGVGLEKLLKSDLENLPKLKTFIASDNKINFIAKNVFENNLKIQQIDLSRNQLKTIKTKSIRGLKELKSIDLTGNKCISEKFEGLDGNERDRQKNMNKIMIKCKEIKKNLEEPSLVMSIKKSVEELNPLKIGK